MRGRALKIVFDELPDKFNITRVEAVVKITIKQIITKAFKISFRITKYQDSMVFRDGMGD